jgi:hypothetical protein
MENILGAFFESIIKGTEKFLEEKPKYKKRFTIMFIITYLDGKVKVAEKVKASGNGSEPISLAFEGDGETVEEATLNLVRQMVWYWGVVAKK